MNHNTYRERLRATEVRQEAHTREHALIQEALDKAERSMTQRLESMNELRAQIGAERGVYVTRDRLDAQLLPLEQRLTTLEKLTWRAAGAIIVVAFAVPLALRLIG